MKTPNRLQYAPLLLAAGMLVPVQILAQQFARPSSTISAGSWTFGGAGGPSSLWDAVDEISPDEGDTEASVSQNANVMQLGLSTVQDPQSASGHIMRFRARSITSKNPGESCSLDLVQGGVTIASTSASLGAGYATYTYTLSAAEADSITNYGALEFHFTSGGVKNGSDTVFVTWAELEVPDEPGVVLPTLSTPTVASVSATEATLGATVDSNGGETLSARGTVWGTGPGPTGNVLAEGGSAVEPYSHLRTGLPAQTQIYFRGYALNSAGTSYSPDGSFWTEPATQADAVSFTSVTAAGMQVNWSRGSGSGVIVLARAGGAVDTDPSDGVEYSDSAAFGSGTEIGTGNFVVFIGSGTSVSVSSLSADTTYHFAVYEFAGSGPGSSGINYLQTTPGTNSRKTVGLATLSAPTVSSIDTAQAILGATIDSDGGGTLSERGTVWGTSAAPTGNALAEGGTGAGSFSHLRDDPLPVATQIFFRGYADNAAGRAYSPDGSFHSEPLAANSVTFPNTLSTSMRISWNRPSGDGVVVLVQAVDPVDASPSDGVEYTADPGFGSGSEIGTGNFVVYSGSATFVDVTGLSPGTDYQVSVFSYAGSGTGSSGINYQQDGPATGIETTGSGASIPSVSSPTATAISTTTSTLGASIDSNGGAPVTSYGTVWGLSTAPTGNELELGTSDFSGAFSHGRTGLPSGTLVYFRGYADNSEGRAFSADGSFYTEPTAAAGVSFSLLTANSCRLSWTEADGDHAGWLVVLREDSAVAAQPADGNATYSASSVFGSGTDLGGGSGEHIVHFGTGTQVDVTGLTPSTTYHVAVYEYAGSGAATNYEQDGPATANATTDAGVTIPSLSSPTATAITTTTATLGASIDSNGGSPVTSYGTFWGTAASPTGNELEAGTTDLSGAFSHGRTGLPVATRIFYRGYADNSEGRAYSPDGSFYTEPNAADTVSFSAIQSTSLRISWNRSSGDGVVVLVHEVDAVDDSPVDGVEYAGNPIFGSGPEIGTGNFVVYSGSATFVDVTGLSPTTVYQVSVFSYAGSGTGGSGINYQQDGPATGSETTGAGASVPLLSSPTVTTITTTTASLGASIDDNGGSAVTSYGTLWGLSASPPGNEVEAGSTDFSGAFSHGRTGLPSGTRIVYRGFADNGVGRGYSPDGSFYTEPTAAATVSFSLLTDVSCRLSWTQVNSDHTGWLVVLREGSAVAAQPADGDATYSASSVFGSGTDLGGGSSEYVVYVGTGTQVDVSGLTPSTTYHAAVYEYAGSGAAINYQQDTPPVNSATTADEIFPPTLSAPTFSAVRTDESGVWADLGGTVDTGPIDVRGTVWNTTGAPVTENEVPAAGTALGPFTQTRKDFPSGTRIYFAAYARNVEGKVYSPEATFVTEPTWAQALNIGVASPTSLPLSWTHQDSDHDGVLVVARQGGGTASPSDFNDSYTASSVFGGGSDLGSGSFVVYKGAGSSVTVTGLSPSTTYYFSVYEYAGNGAEINYQQDQPAVGNGTTLVVTTPVLSAPTAPFATINNSDAQLGATLDSDGNGTVSSRGTVWNTTGTPVVENTLAAGGTALGAYSHSRSGLPVGAQVFFRGYAINEQGTGYSPEASFYTEPTQPSDFTASNLYDTEVTLNWTATGGDGVIILFKEASAVDGVPEDGNYYSGQLGISKDPFGNGSHVDVLTASSTRRVKGLSPSTTYHFAIYAYAGTKSSKINYQQDAPLTLNVTTTAPLTHNLLNGANCLDCHVSGHGEFMVPTGAEVEARCKSCHNPTGAASAMSEVTNHVVNAGATVIDCGMCHEVHNGTGSRASLTSYDARTDTTGLNRSFVRSDIKHPTNANKDKYGAALPNTVFQTRPDDFAYSSGTYNGICQTCHTDSTLKFHSNSDNGPDHSHQIGDTCTDCHGHGNAFQPSGGGGCTSCHSEIKNGRRAVVGEFALTSHHVMGGTVTDDDCVICHYEGIDNDFHQDGKIDLRDPDDGTDATLISITSLSRDRNSATLEAEVTAVQNNFCLKCHDGDGATATHFSGNPLRPFSSADRDVPNVSSSFSTGNSFFHPVLGYKDNPNCNTTTMVAPWTGASSQRISCFDCHDVGGHGSNNQRMLRDPIDFDGMEAAVSSPPAGMGLTVEAFCIRCHDPAIYVDGNTGSAYERHGADQGQHSAGGGNDLGCMGCHGGIVNAGGIGDNGAGRGNIHGGNFTWPSDATTPGVVTEAFALGGWLSGWERGTDRRGNPEGRCAGGDCNHGNGQTYTYDVLD